MIKNLTPHEAYEKVLKLAEKKGMTSAEYVRWCGIDNRFLIHRWKAKTKGTIHLDIAIKLRLI